MHTDKEQVPGTPGHDLINSFHDKFGTILADPPWQFSNRTGKMAPEHRRLNRYATMGLEEIMELPVSQMAKEKSHLYLWVPNCADPGRVGGDEAVGIYL